MQPPWEEQKNEELRSEMPGQPQITDCQSPKKRSDKILTALRCVSSPPGRPQSTRQHLRIRPQSADNKAQSGNSNQQSGVKKGRIRNREQISKQQKRKSQSFPFHLRTDLLNFYSRLDCITGVPPAQVVFAKLPAKASWEGFLTRTCIRL